MTSADPKSVRRGGTVAMVFAAVAAAALAVASLAPRSAAAQFAPPSAEIPSTSATAASVLDPIMPSHLNVGLRGHGFVGHDGNFITIDAPRAGLYTVVFGINDIGETVGGYLDRNGKLHGFIRSNHTLRTIDYPGAAATLAARINSKGQIVGAYSEEANVAALELPHGFLFDNGGFTAIDLPGAVRTQPFGINNQGQIVGEYVDAEGVTHGFLLDEGGFTTLDVPGSTATFALDIDDRGQVLGFSFDGAAFHGFLRDTQGTFTPVDYPGAVRGTLPFGFNNRGQIVGVALVLDDEQLTSRAFVLENGVFTTIEHPDATPTLSTVLFDISDSGRLADVYDLTGHGYIRNRRGDFITVDPPEGNINEVVSFNNRGQIVGRYVDANGRARGFLRDKRGFTPIDVPGATATSVYRINDRGQIVGSYSTVVNNTAVPSHGFLLEGGAFTTIDIPGAQHTAAFGINNRGEIVGEYLDAAGIAHGFLRDAGGALTTVDVPGATQAGIMDINDHGQMVGNYLDAAGTVHAFLLDEGVLTTIDDPSATLTSPFAINNHGQIVGFSFDGVRNHGFLLRNGRFTRITPPGAFFFGTFTTDIDDRGRIAGASL
jgi:probable HAF family extracellular repeat protein